MTTDPIPKAPAKCRSPWPIAIISYFIVFISCTAVFVTWAVRQNMDLVRKDYYEEEIKFQQRLDQLTRTRPLQGAIELAYNPAARVISLQLPVTASGERPSGRIQLYRPSDARLDQDLPLDLNSLGAQQISTRQLRAGLWKVRLSWKTENQDYYHERSLVLN